jgi:hypothetical protein
MATSHIDVIASDVTFTDPAGALEALRRRSSAGRPKDDASSARSLRHALLAYGLEFLDEPPGRCRLQHTGGANDARVLRRARQVIREAGALAFIPARRTADRLISVRDALDLTQLDAIARTVGAVLDAPGAPRFRLQATLIGEPAHARENCGIDCSLDPMEDA